MIVGMVLHGDGRGAPELFSRMEQESCKPDDLTLVAVLTPCSHSGMGREGLRLLDMMCVVYNIEPRKEHYGCAVDILSRAGLFKEAEEETVKATPSGSNSEEEAVAWRTLLSACCCNQGQADDLGKVAAEKLLQIERQSAVYVLMSNWYAAMDKHGDAKRIREMMKNGGTEKTPSCSSIKEVGSV